MSAIDNPMTVAGDLVRLLEDGSRGYLAATRVLTRQGSQEVAVRFRDFAEERAQFAAELRLIAEDNGVAVGSTDRDPSRDWPDLMAALRGDDPQAVIEAVAGVDDQTVDAFDRALAHEDVPAALEPTVRRQVAGVRSVRNEVAGMLAA